MRSRSVARRCTLGALGTVPAASRRCATAAGRRARRGAGIGRRGCWRNCGRCGARGQASGGEVVGAAGAGLFRAPLAVPHSAHAGADAGRRALSAGAGARPSAAGDTPAARPSHPETRGFPGLGA